MPADGVSIGSRVKLLFHLFECRTMPADGVSIKLLVHLFVCRTMPADGVSIGSRIRSREVIAQVRIAVQRCMCFQVFVPMGVEGASKMCFETQDIRCYVRMWLLFHD